MGIHWVNAWDRLARYQVGWPTEHPIHTHPQGTFAFEEGAEIVSRLTDRFGDPAALTCLDLGCGPVETPIARDLFAMPWAELISVEVFPPYLDKLRRRKAGAASHRIVESRIEDAVAALSPGEVDLAVMLDVLEHFPRWQALRVLVKLERVAARGIIVFSPVGVVPQDALDGNPLQRHRSTWLPHHWARLGYEVEVFEGFHGHHTPPDSAAWAIKKLR